jgi:hypothetical protein
MLTTGIVIVIEGPDDEHVKALLIQALAHLA